MEGPRRGDGGDGFGWIMAVVALAAFLHAAPAARALDHRGPSGNRGVWASVNPADPQGSSAVRFLSPRTDAPFSLVDLDLPWQGEFPALGLANTWKGAAQIRSFAAFGTTLVGAQVQPDPTRHDAAEDSRFDPAALRLAAWLGAGTSWTPGKGRHLGIGVGWIPATVGVSIDTQVASEFRTVASFGLSW